MHACSRVSLLGKLAKMWGVECVGHPARGSATRRRRHRGVATHVFLSSATRPSYQACVATMRTAAGSTFANPVLDHHFGSVARPRSASIVSISSLSSSIASSAAGFEVRKPAKSPLIVNNWERNLTIPEHRRPPAQRTIMAGPGILKLQPLPRLSWYERSHGGACSSGTPFAAARGHPLMFMAPPAPATAHTWSRPTLKPF